MSESQNAQDVTMLLQQAGAGNHKAASELFDRVRDTLQQIAQQRMRNERKDHTLQATALVHEAWLKLVGEKPLNCADRGQFFAAAAEAMRRILIDHARQRGAIKRGGDMRRWSLNVVDLAANDDAGEILALDEAIAQLEKQEPDLASVIKLRFFAGLTIDETAAALGQSPRNADRLWTYARARLFRMLSPKG